MSLTEQPVRSHFRTTSGQSRGRRFQLQAPLHETLSGYRAITLDSAAASGLSFRSLRKGEVA